ncbi:hypothetical protein PGSY75_1007500 [Plasmodium gaboni]|uniref:Uncharacterized protein n=1 Tax=Plasmodium gaboni TaxID=647221 RepID=A0A151LKL1_9APIC|nr:hypothetical protein PGSY75_1007500 [Plasmodium gaboni]KYN99452.1 hypothetical protein PGSY75_1007500 [Plasmodium gaboni]SOV22800.1 conserved Plasmodium protein, unknown function [Plasmodium sp. DRC-Itaito]
MVLKDKKYNRKYLKKIKARSKDITEKEEKKSKEDSHYNYEENLPEYDSNNDYLIHDKELLSHILNSDSESSQENINVEHIKNTQKKNKERHIDFVISSLAFNIPLGLI